VKKLILKSAVLILLLAATVSTLSWAAPKTLPDMNTEAGIREYLIGEWYFYNTSDREYYSVRMTIDKDLGVRFDFTTSSRTKATKTADVITGQFSFDRYDDKAPVPDILQLELPNDRSLVGGNFFFVPRTVFDGRRVMSLFPIGQDLDVFGLLDPSGYDVGFGWGYSPDEIIFIKETGEEYDIAPLTNAEFYAVYWGRGKADTGAVWLDDITWPPAPLPDSFNPFYDGWYRFLTTRYENETPISVAYAATDGMRIEGGGDLRQGEAYLVKTNGRGEIITMRHVPYAPPITRGTVTGDRVRMRA